MKEIPLSKGFFAQVDDADFEIIGGRKWYCDKGVYAAFKTKVKGKTLIHYMHRILMDAKVGQQVDHKDGNGLNNQRDNLRLCTNQENQRNRIGAQIMRRKRLRMSGSRDFLGENSESPATSKRNH